MKRYFVNTIGPLVLGLLVCFAAFFSCCRGTVPDNDGIIRLATLRGPSSVAMIKLIDSLASCESSDIEVQIFSEPLQMRKSMLEGSVDFAVLPTTMAALLYNKGVDYRVAAIPLWGSLYLCGTDTTIKGLEDLRGGKVYLMAKGMAPDILFRHLLLKSGIEPYRDVDLDYRFPSHSDLANAAMAGRVPMCVLTEPYLSQVLNANPDLHILLDLTQLWQSVENHPEPETAFLCKGALSEADGHIVSVLTEAYRSSAEWVTVHPDSAAVLCTRYNINPDTLALMQSIPRTGIRVVDAADAEQNITDYLTAFLDMSPESIGGKLPDEGFIVK